MPDVFVYGTLRPNGVLYSVIEHEVLDVWNGYQAAGTLYYIDDYEAYPVADFSDGEDNVIHGTVLQVTDTALSRIRGIELGAGYEERIIKVTGPDCEERTCITYHWPHVWRGWHGRTVPQGDWYAHLLGRT